MIQFTVINYNIQSGRDARNKYDLEATIAVLKASGADILSLNEVDRHWGQRSNWEDQVEILSERLGRENVYAPALFLPAEEGNKLPREYGNLLLSKLPIAESKTVRMYPGGDSSITYDGTNKTEPRSYITAEISFGQKHIRVICTHLSVHSQEARLGEISKIEKEIEKTKEPLVLMGDLNTTSDSKELSILKKYLDDPSEGRGFITYYPEDPRQIDYILTRGLECKNIEVTKSDASDHYSVVAELTLKS